MGNIYVYHHNDHDGIVAAGILYNHMKRPHNMVFSMIDYNKELNFEHIDFQKGDKVFFLDYSFTGEYNKRELIYLLNRRINNDDVVWIDHHISSINQLEEYNIEGIRNKELCGAAWTYLYCKGMVNSILDKGKWTSRNFHYNSDIPTFLKLIDDYDCWKGLYKITNNFHYGLLLSSPEDQILTDLIEIGDYKYTINNIVASGKTIQKYLTFEEKEYHIDMYGFEFTLPEVHGGYRCFCINRKGNSIMFGDKINEYDAVIPFYYINGMWKYSIFTNKDHVDCEKVAKSYGGGGHQKAAGFITNSLIFN